VFLSNSVQLSASSIYKTLHSGSLMFHKQLAECFSFRIFNTVEEGMCQLASLDFWLEV